MDISPCLTDGRSMLTRVPLVLVTNYDALEKLLNYGIASRLHYNATEHPLFIVEDPFSYKEQRLKFAELAFEKLGCPAIYAMKSSSCIGFSLGKTTCVSVDFGASGIRVVPVYDGYSLMTCLFHLSDGE